MNKFGTAFHEAAHVVVGVLAMRERPAEITIRSDRKRNVAGTTNWPPWALSAGKTTVPPEVRARVPKKVLRLMARRNRRATERTALMALAGPAQDTQRDDDWEAQGLGTGDDLVFFYGECGDVQKADALLATFEPNDLRRSEWLGRLANRALRLLRHPRIFRAVERFAVTLYRQKNLQGEELIRALGRAERTVGWPWKKGTRANWFK